MPLSDNLQTQLLHDLFEELERSANELNEYADSINLSIKNTEERLAPMNIGVELFLEEPLLESDPEASQAADENGDIYVITEAYQDLLGFGKAPEDGWCLLIKRVQVQDSHREGGNDEVSHSETPLKNYPLLQASRELRILALGRIPELLKALTTAVDRRVEAIRNSLVGVVTNEQILTVPAARKRRGPRRSAGNIIEEIG
jgi:hypothetical protein